MKNLPDIMKMNSGKTVSTEEDCIIRKKEMLSLFENNAYGIFPSVYGKTEYTETIADEDACAGNCRLFRTVISAATPEGVFSFPVHRYVIKNRTDVPTFLLINFYRDTINEYCPVEEITDNGFNLVYVYYKDITSDDIAYDNGLNAHFPRIKDNSPGKISLWAWALSRVVDVISALPETDSENIAVIGHSRLGKTALWCGANDERIKYVISNDSGSMGASLEYGKHDNAETQKRISEVFPFWFCNKFNKDRLNGVDAVFDQHMLLALSSPRYLAVSSAEEDRWADPSNEFAACKEADCFWKASGAEGFVCEDEIPQTGKEYLAGSIAYHLRAGTHFLSRNDWNFYMNFIRTHIN